MLPSPKRRKGQTEPSLAQNAEAQRQGPSGGVSAASVAPGLSRRRKIWFRLITVALALLLAWGIPGADRPYRESALGVVPDNPLRWRCKLAEAVYEGMAAPLETAASVDIGFLGVRVQTNSYGFRGDEPGPRRRVVLCLGDSTVFGWRVGKPILSPRGSRPDSMPRPSRKTPGLLSMQEFRATLRFRYGNWPSNWCQDGNPRSSSSVREITTPARSSDRTGRSTRTGR